MLSHDASYVNLIDKMGGTGNYSYKQFISLSLHLCKVLIYFIWLSMNDR